MRSILKKPQWYRWRQRQRSTSWRFPRILLFIVQLAFFHCNNEPGWPVDPTASTRPSAEVAISPQFPGALPASQAEFARGVLEGKYKQYIPELSAEQRAVFERLSKGEASLAEQQGMKLLMEQLQEMQPAVEIASGELYEKEMAKTKEWTERIGQAGSAEEALRVLGEAEKALGDGPAFDTAVEVMKESVERQAEAGLQRLGKEWPQAKSLGKCWRGCKGVRVVPSAERGMRARGEIARKLKGAEKARFEELAGKVERHRRVSGLEPWMEMNRGLPAEEIAGNLGQLEAALRLARENPGARVALTLGREPVVWEGAGPPPVPESLRRYAQQPQQLLGTGTDGPVDLRGRVVAGGSSGSTGRPGQPGQILAMNRGESGGTGGASEVGTVRGAGGPASGPEGTARPAEPPPERPAAMVPQPVEAPRFDLAKTIGEIQKQAQGALPLQASGSYQALPTGRIAVGALPAAAEAEALVSRLNDGSGGAQVNRFGKLELVDPQGRTLVLEQKPVEGPAGSTRWEAAENSARTGNLGATLPVNSKGIPYPQVIDLKTGMPIPFPEGEVVRPPESQRISRPPRAKRDFIKEWYDRGYKDPPLPWESYDIHHIKPLEFGGDNRFENLTPVVREVHQKQFNSWWQAYGQ